MNTTMTIKTSKDLRDGAKKTAKKLGIPLTTVVNAMLKQFVRDQMLILEVECPFPSHTPNAETRRAIRDIQQRKNLVSFKTFEEFEKHVRSL
ncbi:MAG: hypothetical protein UY63_C0007G0011 [Parcubacteria group bacterium GW2011_GWA2_51_10]|nr:MAG: hypothetical protein UY63_C0007G0011 [Parcubacteria group bacterium GW2011_GWA2_51_10]